ncbi:MAG TPA: hypothetical protein VF277_05685, partial [Steroidobacteraceae bacterium]
MTRSTPSAGANSTGQSIRIAFDFLRAGRLAEAESLARRLRESTPSVIVSLLSCDVAEQRTGPADALAYVDAALQRYGGRGELLLRRAQLLVALGRWPEATAVALQAAARSPADLRIQHGAALLVM